MGRGFGIERVREGALTLGTLAPGQWRRLTAEEIRHLKAL